VTAVRLADAQRRTLKIDPTTFVEANLTVIVLGLAVALALTIAALAITARRAARLERRLEGITRGEDGRSLEAVLEAHLAKVGRLGTEVDRLAGRTAALESDGRHAFQRIGLVRFNPFEDTGGNQSFALALLDADEDGIVVSSLHARGLTRIYAKSMTRGRPEATLSDEEAEAVALAKSASLGRAALADRVDAGERTGRDRAAERAGV